MAFVKKTWKDRIAEFPTRRRLTKSNGDSELVTVAREEGTLSQEGDAFSAENMNDLESRVDDAISEINSNLNWNHIDTVIGANTISYDASLYKEIRIVVIISGGIKFVNTFQTDIISESSQNFVLGGYYKNSTANAACIVALSRTSAKISTITQNGTDKSTDQATSLSLYAR